MDINSELKDAQLEILDADNTYSANRKGLIWFNRTTDKVKAIFNSAVKILATEEYVDNEVTISANAINTSISDGPILDERSDPSTPASGSVHLYGKTDGVYYKNDSGAVEKVATKTYADAIRGVVTSGTFTSAGSVGSPSVIYTASTPSTVTVYLPGAGAQFITYQAFAVLSGAQTPGFNGSMTFVLNPGDYITFQNDWGSGSNNARVNHISFES